MGGGPFTLRCEQLLERALQVKRAMLTTSATDALEMSALLLDIQPGDEVILPSYTFVSVANAFVLRGARPVFADVTRDTLNIDPEDAAQCITDRTKALVAVHYAGIACDLDRLQSLCEAHGIALIEDNAHGLFGRYRGRALGSFGATAVQSFHETKNFTCGEGGALLINDERLIERAEILRDKGTNRGSFYRHEVDFYTWMDVGSSYSPADILAALLSVQLEQREAIQAQRKRLWLRYRESLAGWAAGAGVRLPHVPEAAEPAYHLFWLAFPDGASREQALSRLREQRIQAVFHYVPLHTSPFGKQFHERGPLPITEAVSETLIRLPFYTAMTEAEQGRVIEAVRSL